MRRDGAGPVVLQHMKICMKLNISKWKCAMIAAQSVHCISLTNGACRPTFRQYAAASTMQDMSKVWYMLYI